MLFASGWTLDEVLGLSWGQLGAVLRCVVAYRLAQVEAVVGGLGLGQTSGGKAGGDGPPRRSRAPLGTRADTSADLEAFCRAAGLRLRTVRGTDPAGQDGTG